MIPYIPEIQSIVDAAKEEQERKDGEQHAQEMERLIAHGTRKDKLGVTKRDLEDTNMKVRILEIDKLNYSLERNELKRRNATIEGNFIYRLVDKVSGTRQKNEKRLAEIKKALESIPALLEEQRTAHKSAEDAIAEIVDSTPYDRTLHEREAIEKIEMNLPVSFTTESGYMDNYIFEIDLPASPDDEGFHQTITFDFGSRADLAMDFVEKVLNGDEEIENITGTDSVFQSIEGPWDFENEAISTQLEVVEDEEGNKRVRFEQDAWKEFGEFAS